MANIKKVFISYSWSTLKHEQWVVNLAERLMADGVDVIIDKWNLKEGNDKYSFMETMVQSKEIDKVLMILDKKYVEKANKREGGVGTETQIISPEIYKNVEQEKFIPIVREKDDEENAYVPTFLEGRIYIDLSLEDTFEENYEKLLRNIYEKPQYNKPKLGNPPSYLYEDAISHTKTNSILRSFDNQITKNPRLANSILKDFLEEFHNALKDYAVNFQSKSNDYEIGKAIYDKINEIRPLRDDFIAFVEKFFKSEINFDIDIIIKFLEKLPFYELPQDKNSWCSYECDNYKFIIHELFIYLIAIGLKTENYKYVDEFLNSSYFFQNKYEYKKEPQSFSALYYYIESIDIFYKQAFSQNYYSPMADFIIKRIPNGYTKDMIVEADLLCHYIATMNGTMNGKKWFPITYIYKTRERFELFTRMVSKRHFEKTKILFGVETISELQNKLKKIKEEYKPQDVIRYSYYDSVLPIFSLIDIDTIGTTR